MPYKLLESTKRENQIWSKDLLTQINVPPSPLSMDTLLESFAIQNNMATGLFDCEHLNYISHSSNLSYLLNREVTDRVFSLAMEFIDRIAPEKRSLIRMSVCGTFPSAYSAGGMNILMKSTPVSFDEYHIPQTYLNSVRDIFHLISGEGFWLRVSFGDEVLCWFSTQKKILFHDVIFAREKEVIELLVQGKHLICIADELGISINTVKNHLKACCNRLFTRNNVGLIQLCFLNDILNQEEK